MDDDRQLSLPLPECTKFVSSTKSSIDRNMKFKLKLSSRIDHQPQSELEVEEDVEEEQEQKQEELLLRVCDFCGKKFSSGKALGGHRRIHLQDRDPVHKSSQKARPPVAGEDQTKQTCCICGKTFPSEKSLFGHMRFHPERSWRGVKPPEAAAAALLNINININTSKHASCSSSTIENQELPVALDLMESLSGWTVTNRRGKRSTYKEPEEEEEEEEEEDYDDYEDDDQMLIDDHAVHNLLSLACAETRKGKTKNFEDDDRNHLLTLKKQKLELDDDDDDEEVEEGEISDKKKRFRCGTCNKSFQTFQALGGHRSSHNKIMTNESTDQHNCSIGAVEMENVHRCKICNKSFSSGQALGGHQRCHWAGPSVSASASEAALGGQRSFFIDLNQPPPPQLEEEEDEEEAGVDSAFNPVLLN